MSIPPLPARFLNWRLDGDGNKIPCLRNGKTCNPHDPANHLTYEDAAAAGYAVAFDIMAQDGLFFLDMDKCLNADGQWSREAVEIYQRFPGAWAEVSQSGTGLHIIGKCDPARLANKKRKWDGWLECYVDKRFVAFSENGWTPIGLPDPGRDFTDILDDLVPDKPEFETPEGVADEYTGPSDDDELLRKMLRSQSAGAAFGMKVSPVDLWNANEAVLAQHYPAFDGSDGFDRNRADMALMTHLAFWTGRDQQRMDRLFRRSALMREKYEKREGYRTGTISRAAASTTRVYDYQPTEVATTPEVSRTGFYLTTHEQTELFEGCVYIEDQHRIFCSDGAMLKPEQFNVRYGGYEFQMQPDGSRPTRKAFEAFTENRAIVFPKATSTIFEPAMPPGAIIDGCVNVYVKPTDPIVEGDIAPFLAFLDKLIPDKRDQQIILSYMAATMQNPGMKFQWAPVLQGTEGNGKTFLANCLAYAVGHKYTHRPVSQQLSEKFNGYLENKLLIIVEEFHANHKRETLDILKPLVTNEVVEVRAMHQEKRMIRNIAQWFFCTNHKDAVIKKSSDRRYAIFFTAQQSYEDIKRDGMGGNYFPNLYGWARNGGYAHVAHFLQTYDIPDEFNPAKGCHRAPITSSTEEAIVASGGVIEHEIREAIESGTQGFRGGWVSGFSLDKLIRDRGIRIQRQHLYQIVEEMGYVRWGRSPKPIFQEDNKKPLLFCNLDVAGSADEYVAAQGYVL